MKEQNVIKRARVVLRLLKEGMIFAYNELKAISSVLFYLCLELALAFSALLRFSPQLMLCKVM